MNVFKDDIINQTSTRPVGGIIRGACCGWGGGQETFVNVFKEDIISQTWINPVAGSMQAGVMG